MSKAKYTWIVLLVISIGFGLAAIGFSTMPRAVLLDDGSIATVYDGRNIPHIVCWIVHMIAMVLAMKSALSIGRMKRQQEEQERNGSICTESTAAGEGRNGEDDHT